MSLICDNLHMSLALKYLELDNGFKPAVEWINTLDAQTSMRIVQRLDRLAHGNFGNCKPVQGAAGLFELAMDFGPGYRAYYGMDGRTIVVVVCGGDKSTQRRNIAYAARLWKQYRNGARP